VQLESPRGMLAVISNVSSRRSQAFARALACVALAGNMLDDCRASIYILARALAMGSGLP